MKTIIQIRNGLISLFYTIINSIYDAFGRIPTIVKFRIFQMVCLVLVALGIYLFYFMYPMGAIVPGNTVLIIGLTCTASLFAFCYLMITIVMPKNSIKKLEEEGLGGLLSLDE